MEKYFTQIFNYGHDSEHLVYYKDEYCKIVHRLDGPAVEYKEGLQMWAKDGVLHRLDGPAVTHKNSPDSSQYWINGELFSESRFYSIIRFGGFV